ncbi:MAG: hypothetical protein AAGF12_26125 [Myxococcota bacterium]
MIRRLTPGLLFLIGCGASTAGSAGSESARASLDSTRERAAEALAHGDLHRAQEAIDEALSIDPSEPATLGFAARRARSRGAPGPALALLSESSRPDLVRLRARARLRMGQVEETIQDLASVEDAEPADGWATAVLPVLRGVGQELYQVRGEARGTIPFVGSSALPIVAIEIDGEEALALVSTAADWMVVDPAIRPEGGVLREVGLGGVTVEAVPALARDLDGIRAELGVDVTAVLGLDLLLRFSFTLDFRERWMVLEREGEPTDGTPAMVGYTMLSSDFLAVVAEADGQSGWFVIDTAGAFPLALADELVDRLALSDDRLVAVPGAASDTIRGTEIRRLGIGNFAVDEVPAVTGLVPEELGALTGTRVSGMIGAMALQQFKLRFEPSRRIVFE